MEERMQLNSLNLQLFPSQCADEFENKPESCFKEKLSIKTGGVFKYPFTRQASKSGGKQIDSDFSEDDSQPTTYNDTLIIIEESTHPSVSCPGGSQITPGGQTSSSDQLVCDAQKTRGGSKSPSGPSPSGTIQKQIDSDFSENSSQPTTYNDASIVLESTNPSVSCPGGQMTHELVCDAQKTGGGSKSPSGPSTPSGTIPQAGLPPPNSTVTPDGRKTDDVFNSAEFSDDGGSIDFTDLSADDASQPTTYNSLPPPNGTVTPNRRKTDDIFNSAASPDYGGYSDFTDLSADDASQDNDVISTSGSIILESEIPSVSSNMISCGQTASGQLTCDAQKTSGGQSTLNGSKPTSCPSTPSGPIHKAPNGTVTPDGRNTDNGTASSSKASADTLTSDNPTSSGSWSTLDSRTSSDSETADYPNNESPDTQLPNDRSPITKQSLPASSTPILRASSLIAEQIPANTGNIYHPMASKMSRFLKGALKSSYRHQTVSLLKKDNPNLIDIKYERGKVVIQLQEHANSISCRMNNVVTEILIKPSLSPSDIPVELFLQNLAFRYDVPTARLRHGASPCVSPIQSHQEFYVNLSVLDECQALVAHLINQKNNMHINDPKAYALTEADLMIINGVKTPFAVLNCEQDGKCAIHAIVTALTPSIAPDSEHHAQSVIDLRRAILMFNLGHWSELMEASLKEDFPELGTTNFKAKYVQTHPKLETGHTDLNSAGLILGAKIVIVTKNLQGTCSLMELRHPSLNGKKLFSIVLLQRGAKEGNQVHRSHYDVAFPLTVLDNNYVRDMSSSQLSDRMGSFTHSENRFLMFSLVRKENPIVLDNIPPKSIHLTCPTLEKETFITQLISEFEITPLTRSTETKGSCAEVIQQGTKPSYARVASSTGWKMRNGIIIKDPESAATIIPSTKSPVALASQLATNSSMAPKSPATYPLFKKCQAAGRAGSKTKAGSKTPTNINSPVDSR